MANFGTTIRANIGFTSLCKYISALGKADHHLVLPRPHHNQRGKDCSETTDWEALQGSQGENVEEMVVCTTDCINVCMDTVVPARSVCCFASNKPWKTIFSS